jgi:hypothetical protein
MKEGPLMAVLVLTRLATTDMYLLRGIPRELQRAARRRAAHEGTTLRRTLLQALREYAAGTWTPRSTAKSPDATPTGRRWAGAEESGDGKV